MKRRSSKTTTSTQVEAMAIVTAAAGYLLTKDPTWFALLLAIVLLALCFHGAAARLGQRSRSRRRSTATSRNSAAKNGRQAQKPAKRLPRLNIGTIPLVHTVKVDRYEISHAAQSARAKQTQRTNSKRQATARAAA